jgi:hypothetical protein
MTNKMIIISITFLVTMSISLLIYFTIINKNVCGGGKHLYKCSDIDASVCVKKGAGYESACKSLKGGGGFKSFQYLNKPRQNDPVEIIKNIAQCGDKKPDENSDAVKCIMSLSQIEADNNGISSFCIDNSPGLIRDQIDNTYCLGFDIGIDDDCHINKKTLEVKKGACP